LLGGAQNTLKTWESGEEGIVIQLTCMLAEQRSRVIDNFRKWDIECASALSPARRIVCR
jgi:hypothetical protein